VLLSSYVTWFEATVARKTSYATAMSLTALVVFLAAALATALGPEKHAVKFGEGNS
jgi:hypothetical protein